MDWRHHTKQTGIENGLAIEWIVTHSKGQLISKQNCRAINSPKNKRWISTSKFTTSRLVQKRVYLLVKRR